MNKRPWPTCTHDLGGKHPHPDPCGKPAAWRAWFSDEKTITEVCDEHLHDAAREPDYVGATAL
jgi:hypothetical protein